jgi:Protein implicated in ribosomal biogenesis, Nop56p homolog
VITFTLDDFGLELSVTETTHPVETNMIDVHFVSSDDLDLLYYRHPTCPQCGSHSIVHNGTFIRKLETGVLIRIQKYKCKDCLFSFEARPPNHGYGKHISENTTDKSIRGRVKTSLRKTSEFFSLMGNTAISHETVRKHMPDPPHSKMASSGYFVYDEQYVHIDGDERYRALLKDAKNGNFVEEILDDLKEETLIGFFIRSLSKFTIPEEINITTDGYHYSSILKSVSYRLNIHIRRQRCLFHIEKDLAHKIKDAKKEKELDMAKRLVKYMFFQNEGNLRKPGENREAVEQLTEGKEENEIVEIILEKIRSLYGDENIISTFLESLKTNRKEVFLYLTDPEVEKTSDKAEQHFSIMSWLFKHRFKTKEGLLKTSYWYHHYLSTGN